MQGIEFFLSPMDKRKRRLEGKEEGGPTGRFEGKEEGGPNGRMAASPQEEPRKVGNIHFIYNAYRVSP